MKKMEYIAPTMEQIELRPMQLLSGSGVNSSDYGIEYGGVDVGGTIDPAAPELSNLESYFD